MGRRGNVETSNEILNCTVASKQDFQKLMLDTASALETEELVKAVRLREKREWPLGGST